MDFTIVIIALSIGLTSSLHCVGMCGPIALSLGLESQNKLKFTLRNFCWITKLSKYFDWSFDDYYGHDSKILRKWCYTTSSCKRLDDKSKTLSW